MHDKKKRCILSPQEAHVLLEKGTEPPFSGQFYEHFENGVYGCRQCGKLLYRANDKFYASCGWPSFDDALPGAVIRQPDADGRRVEIICAYCQGHLGHVFVGEQLTLKNTRHCVNSLSLEFIPFTTLFEEAVRGDDVVGAAIFAAGCFWGVQHRLQMQPGVLASEVGYIGGHTLHPTYEQVCEGRTGHAEAVRLVYLLSCVSYEKLVELFFNIHDISILDQQGPNRGTQYRSAIFYCSEEQKAIALRLKQARIKQGIAVATEIAQADRFWPAEEYHQYYYKKHPQNFSC